MRPNVDMLIYASTQDRESYRPSLAFLRDARPPIQTYRLLAPAGGHNLRSLSRALPQLLGWLSEHLAGVSGPAPAGPATAATGAVSSPTPSIR